MRALVIGGRGHLGAQAVAGLRAAGAEVVIGGRAAAVRVDLGDPSTWGALAGFDLIINCADTVTAPPDAVIAHCLAQGLTWLETASEPAMVRRVLAAHRAGALTQGGAPRGVVVMGAGIFTGLSNLLAAATVEAANAKAARGGAPCAHVSLGIRWSPLSAGGGGMVNLVGHLLGVATTRYIGGQPVEGPPAEAGPALPFDADRPPTKTLHLPFSEADMLAASLHLPGVAVYGALQPALLGAVFLLTPLWLLRSRLMRGWLWLQFTLLRRVLLRWRRSPVSLVVVAQGASGEALATGRLHAVDGMALAGAAIAAQAEALRAAPPAPGLHMADACMAFAPVFARAQALCATACRADIA